MFGVNLFFIFGSRPESPFSVVRRGGKVSRQPCVTLELPDGSLCFSYPCWMHFFLKLETFLPLQSPNNLKHLLQMRYTKGSAW